MRISTVYVDILDHLTFESAPWPTRGQVGVPADDEGDDS